MISADKTKSFFDIKPIVNHKNAVLKAIYESLVIHGNLLILNDAILLL